MNKLKKWFGRGGGAPAPEDPARHKMTRRTCVVIAGVAMMAMIVAQGFTWGQEKKEEAKPAVPAATPAPQEASKEPPKPTKAETDKKIADVLATPKCMLDTVWVLITGMLVFFMNLGFATVEAGMCRVKNAVNILSKNFIVFAASAAAYYFLGWGLMFGDGNPWFGTSGLLMVGGDDVSPLTNADYTAAGGVYGAISWTGIPLWAKFFFQLVFAGTAATIVSGAVAERIKYGSFIIFTFFMGTVIYPVVGHWIWGGGFLSSKGFVDFAGSTQVHSIGGWAALVGAWMLGPRIGKYNAEGKVQPLPGHSMMAATIGTFILWFGWFGFNPGSTMGLDAVAMSEITVTTNTAAAFATLAATATSWILMGKPDLGMTLNGCLAGLVAITAPCAFVSVGSSVIIGTVAGILVVLAVMMFDKLKIDDPVGATSVHLVNGVFGTICVGLFGTADRVGPRTGNGAILEALKTDPNAGAGLFMGGGFGQLGVQLMGVAMTGVYVVVASFIFWSICKATVGMRVPADEETQGLDIGEHGMEAYSGFTIQNK
jgi:ammonium transporter, Amt family